ncbi:hypothetical protein [Paenibacillus sp. A14]
MTDSPWSRVPESDRGSDNIVRIRRLFKKRRIVPVIVQETAGVPGSRGFR